MLKKLIAAFIWVSGYYVYMSIKVCKFGGSSVADAKQINKVRSIVQSDGERRFIIPSAPGKRNDEDQKITDLLYLCHEHVKQGINFDDVFAVIQNRYLQIAKELSIKESIKPHLEKIYKNLCTKSYDISRPDYPASRGEYLNGLIIAQALDAKFINASELIFFDKRGRLDETKTYNTIAKELKNVARAVVPGFYGTDANGNIKTFSRGGSDISGAIIARGTGAGAYENWTDVSGLLMADPRIVDNPRTIEKLTYKELRELSYMGATVLHDEAVFPVRQAGIELHIKNTNRTEDLGTRIIDDNSPKANSEKIISGIAGKKNFTVIAVEKAMMNSELGFGRRILDCLERAQINFEHMPSSIDSLSVIIEDAELKGNLETITEQIKEECQPDNLNVLGNMALIATVGKAMAYTPGISAKLFGALAEANVNVRMINQGSSELNIIVGVDAKDYEKSVRAIYHAFVS